MDQKGFLGTLFDMSFSSFVTMKVIRFLYVVAIISVALLAVGTLVAGLQGEGAAPKLGAVILAPIVFFIGLLLARVYMELLMVIFRIAENTSIMAQHVTAQGKPTSWQQQAPPPEPPQV